MPSVETLRQAGFCLLVDSREKRPYHLPLSKEKRLQVGDYSIEGMEDVVAIERKGFDDLFACLTFRLPRLRAQLRRLARLPYRFLFVDATPTLIRFGHLDSYIPGEEALARLMRLGLEFGIPIVFCEKSGPSLALTTLYEVWKMERRKRGNKDDEPTDTT